MRKLPRIAFVMFASIVVSPAVASGEGSAKLRIAAEINTFCRLSADVSGPLSVADGRAEIGTVGELCNTSAGYVVHASFTNLKAGVVIAGPDSAAVDSFGHAAFSHHEARSEHRAWQLRDAVQEDPSQSITLQLSIMPL